MAEARVALSNFHHCESKWVRQFAVAGTMQIFDSSGKAGEKGWGTIKVGKYSMSWCTASERERELVVFGSHYY